MNGIDRNQKFKLDNIADDLFKAYKSLEALEGLSSLTSRLKEHHLYLKSLTGRESLFDKSLRIYNYSRDNSYGIIGTPTNIDGYHVGDIVETETAFGMIKRSIICENEKVFTVYGWGKRPLLDLIKNREMRLIKKFNEVTEKDKYKIHYPIVIE